MMRRPLLWACVCMILMIALWIGQTDAPPFGQEVNEAWDGRQLEMTAGIVKKEKRFLNGDIIWKIQLSIISVPHLGDGRIGQNTQVQELQFHDFDLLWEASEQEALDVELGDQVWLRGTYRAYFRATNPGEFDANLYYGSQKIYGKITEVQILERCPYTQTGCTVPERIRWKLKRFLGGLREALAENLQTAFPAEEASVLMKMVLGDASRMEQQTRELYQDGGILHILAISGLHITMLGMGVYHLLRLCGVPGAGAGIGGILFLLLYGMMTGWSLSACRAVGMYLIRVVGELLERDYDMLTAMGVLALILVCRNPRCLYQSSFWLSFGAVCGMACSAYQPLQRRAFYETKRQRYLRKGADKVRALWYAGVSVSFMTFPIQSYFFFQIPLYSVFANLLVLPFVSILLGCALLACLVPAFGPAAMLGCLILKWYRRVCTVVSVLPGHLYVTGRPKKIQIVVYYGILAVYLLWRNRWIPAGRKGKGKGKFLRRRKDQEGQGDRWKETDKVTADEYKKDWKDQWKRNSIGNRCWLQSKAVGIAFKYLRRRGVGIGVTIFLFLVLHQPWEHGFSAHFIDVGQGDAILVSTGGGQHYLFDCGSSNRQNIADRVVIPVLRYYGIAKLDGVFLSHGDADHCNGISELLKGENAGVIRKLYLPDAADKTGFSELEVLAKEKGIPVSAIGEDFRMQWNRYSLVCLYPPRKTPRSDNEASACFLWQIDGYGILLTGDIEGEGERELLKKLQAKSGGLTEKNEEVQRDKAGQKKQTGQKDKATQDNRKRDLSFLVLKVAHHGSRNASSEEFIETVNPQIAIISAGRNNRYGHPHEETLERLSACGTQIYRTDRDGAVTITLKGGKIRVEQFGR